MKRFWFPLICALAFIALLVSGLWIGEVALSPIVVHLLVFTIVALLTATVVSLVWAVAGRTKGSLIKSIVLWIVAIPTVLAELLLALLVFASQRNPEGSDDFVLVVIPILGIMGVGLVAMLFLAALPVKSKAASPERQRQG